MERCIVGTPIGPVLLSSEGGFLVGVSFVSMEAATMAPAGVLQIAKIQLDEYFQGKRSAFSIPCLRPAKATLFQNRVWDALTQIPFGAIRKYGEIAAELGTGPRAVGGACARNALPLIIPCHRVVSATGLGGYCGEWETGLAQRVKKALLEHEAALSFPSPMT